MSLRETATYRLTLFLSLITISIILVDRPLAIFINNHLTALEQPFRQILSGIEFLSDFPISRYLVAALVLITGLLLLIRDKTSQRAKFFFFIGATLASSRVVTGVLKIVFGRTRPYDFIEDQSLSDFFCAGGNSFPSGHATNYFGFFLPLMVLFPRYKGALLVIPAFVALQRVVVNDHYLSDVLAGILIASLMTLLFQRVFQLSSLQNQKSKIEN